jgi:hypothetical protein
MKGPLSIFLILLTLALFYNNTANWHYHHLPNGIVMEHAHPYATYPSGESPLENHQHSDLEYLILDTIYHAAIIIILALAGLRLFPGKPVTRTVIPAHIIINRYSSLPSLRAPPSV